MEFRTVKWKQILYCLLIAAFGALFFLGALFIPDQKFAILAWILVCIFGFVEILMLIQLFDSGMKFKIDESGIWDARYPDAPVTWDQINFITISQVQYQKFLSVHIKNLDAFLEKVPEKNRRVVRSNERSGYGAIAAPMMFYNHSAQDAIDYIKTIHPEKVK